MTALVTGGNGQLGRALRARLPDARSTDLGQLDITDAAAVEAFDWTGTTVILNAAAWTAVDAAEDEPVKAWAANATAVAHLAAQARRLGVPLVHVSTDYVFAGDATAPYAVDAPIAPRSVYGITKAAGEAAALMAPQHLVVRTSWVYGDGGNFVRTMRRLAQTHAQVSVVDDQLGRPTHADDLAASLLHLLDAGAWGTHHVTGAGDVASWADVAEAALVGTGCQVRRVSTAEYGASKAPRPSYSALAVEPGLPVRDWREALAGYEPRA